MNRGRRPRWVALVSAGVVLALMMVSLVGGSGKAWAASTIAALLSGRSSQGTSLDGIEVLSWSHGVSAPRDVATGQATGKRQYQPLLIRKRIDKASPLLYRALGQAETFPSLKFVVNEQAAGAGSLTVTLTNAQVIEIITADVNGDGMPEESVSFNFTKIQWSANGVSYEDVWSNSPPSPPAGAMATYAMAINEKGLPGTPKKSSQVLAYQSQITSPRDPASGLPTGKRQHKPFSVMVASSDDTPELTQAFLTGKSLDMVSVMTYGADGKPTGAVSLLGVQVLSMTETRRSIVVPHVLETSAFEASASSTGPECVYELSYRKIQWLDRTGGVTYEDSWDAQR